MNWMMDYENYLSQHGVEGQKWGVMHGPPYPLTGENKKAFKADKKAFYKNEKKAGQINTSYATEQHGNAMARAKALEEAGFWQGYAGKMTGDKKAISKGRLYDQASREYKKYADVQYKNTEHGKRNYDRLSNAYKQSVLMESIMAAGSIGMTAAVTAIGALSPFTLGVTAGPAIASLFMGKRMTDDAKRNFELNKYTYGLEAAQTFSSKKFSNKQLDNLIKEELKSSNYNGFDDPNELTKALEDMLKLMPQNNTNALDPYTQHKPVKVKMT